MSTVKIAAACTVVALCAGYAAKSEFFDFGGVSAPLLEEQVAVAPSAPNPVPQIGSGVAGDSRINSSFGINAIIAEPAPVLLEDRPAVLIDEAERKLAAVDGLMRAGSFALYGPETMVVEQANTVALDIAGVRDRTLAESITSNADGQALSLIGAQQDFEWFPEMSATLTGTDFTIEPSGPVYVRIRDGKLARDVDWQVIPTKTGNSLPLKLTLEPDFSILGDDAPTSRDFTTTKIVRVTARPMLDRLSEIAADKGPDWIIAGGTGVLAFFGTLLAGRVRKALGSAEKAKK